MRIITSLCLSLFLLSSFVEVALARPTKSSYQKIADQIEREALRSKYRGWDDLVERLKLENLEGPPIEKIYTDSRMPYFTPVTFKLEPKESKRIYTPFLQSKKVGAARRFLRENKRILDSAHASYSVEPSIIVAILLVETNFGEYTGNELVIHRLSRLASIAEPVNLKHNFELLRHKEKQDVSFEQVVKRGKYVQELFYPEILALIQIAKSEELDLFKIQGSRAGAFGIPQFLPTTYLKFAVDGNNDGKISLFQMEDAIHSAANFLASFGWKEGISEEKRREVIYKYNRSDAYVDTILAIAGRLQP